ncbi:MAG: hypothetical protein ABL909_10195 [Sphingopyxis sp.]
MTRIGRAMGGALGGKATKAARSHADDPLIAAVVGAASLFVANKLLPRRIAAVGAAVAAGYVTRKLAQRAERISARNAEPPSPDTQARITSAPKRRNVRAIKPDPANP